MRIHELSKMINVSNKEIIAKLAGLGILVKSHMSKVDDAALKKLEYIFGKKVSVAAKKKTAPAKAKKTAAAKEAPKTKEKAAPDKAPVKTETQVKKPIVKKPAKPVIKPEPAPAAKKEAATPEKPAKEIDSEKIAKFKSKPGMQRAFDSVRRVDASKKGQISGDAIKGKIKNKHLGQQKRQQLPRIQHPESVS